MTHFYKETYLETYWEISALLWMVTFVFHIYVMFRFVDFHRLKKFSTLIHLSLMTR